VGQVPANNALHRIAARLQFGVKRQGVIWAANGERQRYAHSTPRGVPYAIVGVHIKLRTFF